ncbi:hypothetical protein EW145_g7477 [Phellinidium pouzarii]|uniref:Uncharacterized protein n=1 Tax=Phellinidium pouzarii TaxID=167371 RepID=A0A4V6S0Y5_9AGAM|nr:hypothetical protein EW145_g7477 [Phellinidium pouzarii]
MRGQVRSATKRNENPACASHQPESSQQFGMCSRAVFRCFRWLERAVDKITGAAGPLFVTLAVVLITLGIFCFLPLDALIAFNLLGHYYLACTVSPGFVEGPSRVEGKGLFWARRQKVLRAGGACVLLFFFYVQGHALIACTLVAYLVLSTFCFAVLGYEKIWEAMGFSYTWAHWTPEVLFSLIYILCVVLCFAVGVMLLWHVWSICVAETSVENHDHDVYRRFAKERGQTFENSFDLGKLKNLELFFNLGEGGYSYTSLLLPLRVMPYTDGRTWARRLGYATHRGVQPGEELTDDDDDDDDEA